MTEIKIINGTYGYRSEGRKYVTPIKAGERVEVSDEEAARLVALGVAIITWGRVAEAPAAPVATPTEGADGGGRGDDPPAGNGGAEGDDEGESEGGTFDIVDGHILSLIHISEPRWRSWPQTWA